MRQRLIEYVCIIMVAFITTLLVLQWRRIGHEEPAVVTYPALSIPGCTNDTDSVHLSPGDSVVVRIESDGTHYKATLLVNGRETALSCTGTLSEVLESF